MPENFSRQAVNEKSTAQSNNQRTVLTPGTSLTGSQRIVIAPSNQVTFVNKNSPMTISKQILPTEDKLKPNTLTEDSRVVVPKVQTALHKEPVRIVLPPQKSKGNLRTKMSNPESPGQSDSHSFKSAVAAGNDPQKNTSQKCAENEKCPSYSKVNLSMPEICQSSKSSQKYLDYLEEMELRIRYMKNDIEFKQNQMQSRKTNKTLQEMNPKRAEFQLNEQKILVTNNLFATTFKSNRLRESDTSSRFSAVTKNVQSTKWTKPTSDNHKTQLILQHLETVPLPGNSVPSNSVTGNNFSASSVTSDRIGLSSYKMSHAHTLQSSNTQASLPTDSQPSKPIYLSPNKRSAIFSNNPKSSLSASSHNSMGRPLFSSLSQDDKNQPISNVLSSQSQGLSSHHATSLDNKFKLVNTSQSKGSCQLEINTQLKINAPSCTSTPTSSSDLVRRYQTKKTPTLNTKSAAKLVSKYKLKRLSPTSAIRLDTQLQRNTKDSFRIAGRVRPSPFGEHKNIHKLDRRNASDIADTQLKSTLDVNENRQKPPYSIFKPYRWDQMKLNELGQANTAMHRLSGQAKNLHKLDRRTEKNPGNVLRRRRSKHHWVSHKLASSQEENLAVEPRYLTQSSAIPHQNLKSRFKWLRPSIHQLHTQNLLRQKMKQRLKMGYGRTHKYASFNAEKSSWHQSQSLKARRYSFKGNMIRIGGVLYKSSNRKLIRARRMSTSKTEMTFDTSQANRRQSLKNHDWRQQKMKLILLRGTHFNIDTRRRKLSRAVMSSPAGASVSGSLPLKVGDEKARMAASRAVYRSIAIATAKFKKNNTKSRQSKQHCIFFGRFGKCFRGDSCPYIHDSAKIAVCTRFLRGKCEDVSCPFSHKASVNKMPVCLFYLRGSCSRDGCPYLHVKVNPDAPVCRDFRNGFCSLGDKCKKLHSFVCPSFADTGTCNRGSNCPMLHRISKKTQAKRRQLFKQGAPVKEKLSATLEASSNSSESQKGTVQPMTVALNSAPLTSQPSFISLLSHDSKSQTPAADSHIQAASSNKELISGEQPMSSRIMPIFLTQQISKSVPNMKVVEVCEPRATGQDETGVSEKVFLPADSTSFDTANDDQVKTDSVPDWPALQGGHSVPDRPALQSSHSLSDRPALQSSRTDTKNAFSQPGTPIKIIPSFLAKTNNLEVVAPKDIRVQSEENNTMN